MHQKLLKYKRRKGVNIMATFIMNSNQKPTEETLKRLSELRDEDIIYDEDCPELTPRTQKTLAYAVEQRNRVKKSNSGLQK